jgi:hypothetical protein
MPWRSKQCRSSRYEIPPVHSILIKALEDDWRRVTRLYVSRTQGANAATQVRRVVKDRFGSKAAVEASAEDVRSAANGGRDNA